VEFEVLRYNGDGRSTLGMFFYVGRTRQMLCYTLEDEHRDVKVPGNTRIPAGRYQLTLRTEGGMTLKYAERFPEMHRGMLWLLNVPGFQWVYFHCGNTDVDTDGCILFGQDADEHERRINASGAAYRDVYPLLADAVEAGPTFVSVTDFDRPRWGQ
jgi:hypothetical protein